MEKDLDIIIRTIAKGLEDHPDPEVRAWGTLLKLESVETFSFPLLRKRRQVNP